MNYKTHALRSPTHRPQPTRNDAQACRWSFGEPRLHLDRHDRGTHAGLPHWTIPLLHMGQKVGYLDVHLHHNSKGLSVGSTICLYTTVELGDTLTAAPDPERQL